MSQNQSPFRLLAKTYSSQLMTRDQYILARAQLLKILQSKGTVTEDDLRKIISGSEDKSSPTVEKSYSHSDWIIITLGLIAAIVLAYVLYN